jgi:hypothetical protein
MFTKLFALFACVLLSGCGADTGSTQGAQPLTSEEIKDENKEESKEESKKIEVSKESSDTATPATETVSVKSPGTSVGSTSSTATTASSSAVGVSSGLKLTMASCADPDASKVDSSVTYTNCAGVLVTGTMGNCTENNQVGCITTSTYKAADTSNLIETNIKSGIAVAGVTGSYSGIVYSQCTANRQVGCITTNFYQAVYQAVQISAADIKNGSVIAGITGTYTGSASPQCSSNFQTSCIANATYKAADLTNLVAANVRSTINIGGIVGSLEVVGESHTDCTNNNQIGCVTTSTYKSADFTSLIASNIKSGALVAGVFGTYPSESTPLASSTGITNLDATMNTLLRSDAQFEWFDRAGTRYTATGTSNLTALNVKNGISLFGVTGTLSPGEQPSAWDIRSIVNVNGVTGLAKMACRDDTDDTTLMCDSASWITQATVEGHLVYKDRFSNLKWIIPASAPMTWTSNASVCAALATSDGGWRIPSRAEVKQALLNKMTSINAFASYLGLSGNNRAWANTPNSNPSFRTTVSVYVADASVAYDDNATMGFCVK